MTYIPGSSAAKCLGAILYDPATQVNKSGALNAVTALDTTNLRLTFTAPASGKVLVRIGVCNNNAGSEKTLLCVLDGATVRLRLAVGNLSNTSIEEFSMAQGIIDGLTPGTSYTFDAAYSMKSTGTGPSYGGPNDTSLTDGVTGAVFEIWEVLS